MHAHCLSIISSLIIFKVYPLVEKYLSSDRSGTDSANAAETPTACTNRKKNVAKNDRLVQLMIKGLLYESCVDYCQVCWPLFLLMMVFNWKLFAKVILLKSYLCVLDTNTNNFKYLVLFKGNPVKKPDSIESQQ